MWTRKYFKSNNVRFFVLGDSKVGKTTLITTYLRTKSIQIQTETEEEFIKGIEDLKNELDSAEIIIAGGKGMKNAEGFKLLNELAKTMGGTVGASRGAVDIGIAPHSIQIGQTGKTVSPKLYIACGISGAIQHTCGITNSNHIIF